MNPALLLYCRPGFEKECAQEITHAVGQLGIDGYVKSKPDSGYLLFVPNEEGAAKRAKKQLRFADFTFPRQIVHQAVLVEKLPLADRATPIAAVAANFGMRFSAVWAETADTNEAKELSSFCRKFTPYLEKSLRKQNVLSDDATLPRLHVFFIDHATAYIGIADPHNSATWPMGIPRLRSSNDAPSRSAQKLVEALHVFLSPEEQADQLHEGITAVDLGAAPGGWTWVLVRHGVQVTAIDNGALAPILQKDSRVEHLRVDGIHWRPKRPVHWLVCDMVDKPARIAGLMADWFVGGHCSSAIFNLKLPMKKRYEEVELCRDLIMDALAKKHIKAELSVRQLYHDREEVTCYLRTLSRR
ncbi:MAG TPA: 23S rRNA (cytidine(2498)-2'-O)-methyltransferase RlmM [Rhodocyclaceae bacterium]|nr:23S rRNA (cytidine(2498)-2'-O)-methyltransferase RlmM [Rhodocyclaceae bacterium]